MNAITKMRNIGPKSAAWLRQVGIHTQEELHACGALEAYIKVRRAGFKPSLNLLYALEGAIIDCHWQSIPTDRRSELILAANAALESMVPPKGPKGQPSIAASVTTFHGDEARQVVDEADSSISFYEFNDADYAGGDKN